MVTTKKYASRVVQEGDTWTAEILRRKTAKETIVSKAQSGFASDLEANVWCEEQLEKFLWSLKERNKRRSVNV